MIMRRVAGTEGSRDELKEQNAHGKSNRKRMTMESCRDRIIMRRVSGTECSWEEELQKQNDQGGGAGTGPSEFSP
jgi:hypothetical protein